MTLELMAIWLVSGLFIPLIFAPEECMNVTSARITWLDLCSNYKSYFESFAEAVKQANNQCNGRCIYGQEASAEDAAEWCQRFWEALPDSPSIRREPFYKICDLAEWWFEGAD